MVYSTALGLAAFICMSLSTWLQADGDYRPTNLKILPKDISHEELEQVMHSYNKALGVHCDYCHAKKQDGTGLDFASDANPFKNTARDMMKMTMDINKRHFKPYKGGTSYMQVSCITCHNGKTSPEMVKVTN